MKKKKPETKGSRSFSFGGKNNTVVSAVASNVLRELFGSRNDFSSTDLYDVLGYPDKISFSDYKRRYLRQDIAQRVVRAPVDATWRHDPEIACTGDTSFNEAILEIVENTSLYTKLHRADILANLGRFAVVYIGFDGAVDLQEPPSLKSKVSYFSPISEENCYIKEFDNSMWSKRFGLPNMYTIQTNSPSGDVLSQDVHWSRVVHIAENTLDSEVYGIPVLQPIYNRLIGLEKLAGGSPEMFWHGARPGYVAKAAENSILNNSQLSDLKEQLSDFSNYLSRWMFAEGIDIQSLSPQVVSPLEHVEVQLKLISSATQIPLRILVGSEKGELASGQDERAWLAYIDSRRSQIGEKRIIKPLIDRLIEVGTLPNPSEGYYIEWKPINITSEKERAEIGRILTDALQKYSSTPGASVILPPDVWLKNVWNLSEEDIAQILEYPEEPSEEVEISKEEGSGSVDTKTED